MRPVNDLIEHYYRNVTFGQTALEDEIRQALKRGLAHAIDAGCGTDAPLVRKFSDKAWVVGVDLCPCSQTGLPIIQGDLSRLPFRDRAFSLIFSRSVFEHLTCPERVLDEFYRVLQPGGVCIILTPNRFDYTSVVAALTPQKFHDWFVRTVYVSAAYDTFPTVYRANTPRYFRSFVKQSGRWRLQRLSGLRHYPVNLAFSRLFFRLGILYDWVIGLAGLTMLQPSLLVVLEKGAQDSAS
jgi:ubiquinone/menaquinone biosynthesis C-methylase UbiE